MKKVLLINPARNYIPEQERKVCTQPLGIAYVAAAVRQAGYHVQIIDAAAEGYKNESPAKNGFVRYGLSVETIKERIASFKPDIVGVGCVQSLQLYEAYEIFDIVKALDLGIITVFGGAHASALYSKEIKKKEIDYIVVGEGEVSFIELLKQLTTGNKITDVIPGVAYHTNGDMLYAPGPRVENLDTLPLPAYDLLPMQAYNHAGASPSSFVQGGIAILQTSRGCPHQCLHCPVHIVFGDSYRCRSIDNVMREIQFLVEQYNIEEICIEDSNFTINRRRVIEFCRKLKECNITIRFSLPHGIEVNTLDEELLRIMWNAGFYALHLSIESANTTVLDTQDKVIISTKVHKVVQIAKEIGYKITGYFMIGFPEETMEDVKKTIAFAEQLKLHKVNFFIYTPLPGTVIYEECLANDFFKPNFDITHLRYGNANINTPHLDYIQIQRIRREAWQKIMGSRCALDESCSGVC